MLQLERWEAKAAVRRVPSVPPEPSEVEARLLCGLDRRPSPDSSLAFLTPTPFLPSPPSVTHASAGYVDTDMTSHRGFLTPEEGARTPFYLSQLANPGKGGEARTGEFYKHQAVASW